MLHYEDRASSLASKPVLEWDVDTVVRWVSKLGLGKYAGHFQGNCNFFFFISPVAAQIKNEWH